MEKGIAINTPMLVFDDLSDFLVEQPSLDAIIEYRLPEAMEARVHELLEKNREAFLTRDEQYELNDYLAADHFMTLLKSKARLKLANKF